MGRGGIFESVLRYCGVFLFVGALLWLAVIAANLVPDAAIERNVAPILSQETSWEGINLGTRSWILDTFTECIGDSIGISGSENIIVRSLESRTFDECTIARQSPSAAPHRNYWRYWHGYQIISRPALALISPVSLRDLNQLAYVGALLALLILATSSFGPTLALAAVAAGSLVPTLSQFSLYTHSLVWIIAFVAAAYLIRINGEPKRISFGILFMILGMLTSFFDFLTNPIVTLTIPLIALCLFWRRQGSPVPQQISRLLKYSGIWMIGYLGFWSVKWGLALLFVPGADLRDLVQVVEHRAGNSTNETLSVTVNRLGGIKILAWQSRIACFLVGGILLAALTKAFMRRELRFESGLLPLSLVACLPLGWALVALNHTVQHHWFVTPIVVPSLFVVAFLSLDYLLPDREQSDPHRV